MLLKEAVHNILTQTIDVQILLRKVANNKEAMNIPEVAKMVDAFKTLTYTYLRIGNTISNSLTEIADTLNEEEMDELVTPLV